MFAQQGNNFLVMTLTHLWTLDHVPGSETLFSKEKTLEHLYTCPTLPSCHDDCHTGARSPGTRMKGAVCICGSPHTLTPKATFGDWGRTHHQSKAGFRCTPLGLGDMAEQVLVRLVSKHLLHC